MNNVDVVTKFGEPEGKPKEHNVIPIYVDYKELGLQIDFKSANYEEKDNPMSSICIYQPS